MSFVERFIIQCPYFGESTIGGSTVLLNVACTQYNMHTCIILCECVEIAVIHTPKEVYTQNTCTFTHLCTADQNYSMQLISAALPDSTFLPPPPPMYAMTGE